MSLLVQAKRFDENIGSLPINRKIHKFALTREDSVADEMIVHLYVLSPGVKPRILCELDVVEIIELDQVLSIFKEYHVRVERETGPKLKTVRVDSEGEYWG